MCMRRLLVIVMVGSLLAVTPAAAQQPTPGSSTMPAMPAGMDAHMAQHMEMCRQMMPGGMMGGGMMAGGMMGGGDPKQQAELLAMRGEMMKAMGDIMMKYAQRASAAK